MPSTAAGAAETRVWPCCSRRSVPVSPSRWMRTGLRQLASWLRGAARMVQVEQTSRADDGWIFEVHVSEKDSETKHRVTLTRADYERITREAISPEMLVQKTFEFLLAREPKEAI